MHFKRENDTSFISRNLPTSFVLLSLSGSTVKAWSHNVNVTGGNEKLNFMLSGNYYTKDGVMKINTDKFQSFNFRSKINAQVFPFLKITNNTQYYDKSYRYYGKEGGGNPNFVNITVHALPASRG